MFTRESFNTYDDIFNATKDGVSFNGINTIHATDNYLVIIFYDDTIMVLNRAEFFEIVLDHGNGSTTTMQGDK